MSSHKRKREETATVLFVLLPRGFEGVHDTVQRNAIRALHQLACAARVLLVASRQEGQDGQHAQAVQQVAQEEGCAFCDDVECTTTGKRLPLMKSVFALAGEKATAWGCQWACYVNSDIVLGPDFDETMRALFAPAKAVLMTGRRTNVNGPHTPIPFDRPDWWCTQQERAAREGTLHAPTGIDWLVHTPGLFDGHMPPFAVGQYVWDMWCVGHAVRHPTTIQTIDATATVLTLHQETNDRIAQLQGPEHKRSLALSQGVYANILACTHVTTPHDTPGLVDIRPRSSS